MIELKLLGHIWVDSGNKGQWKIIRVPAYTHQSFPTFTGNTGFQEKLFQLHPFISIVKIKPVFPLGQLRYTNVFEALSGDIHCSDIGQKLWQRNLVASYWKFLLLFLFFFFFSWDDTSISEKSCQRVKKKTGSQEISFRAFPKIFLMALPC